MFFLFQTFFFLLRRMLCRLLSRIQKVSGEQIQLFVDRLVLHFVRIF